MMPTADQVARTIIAAARLMKVDPEQVALHPTLPKKLPNAIDRGRARMYAALAIAGAFGNDTIASRIFRMSEQGVSTIRWQIKHGTLKWFDPRIVAQIKAEADIPGDADGQTSREPAPSVRLSEAPATPQRPFISERQARAYADLELAMRNTAKLPKGGSNGHGD